jgi:hypothetical protein
MQRSLRHVSSQPHLRVMALLAWLMLALLPAHARQVPMAMSGASMPTTMQQANVQHPHDSAAECCTDQLAMATCHCAAGCAFTAPLVQAPGLAPVLFTARPAALVVLRTPGQPRVPPLRPPLVQMPS